MTSLSSIESVITGVTHATIYRSGQQERILVSQPIQPIRPIRRTDMIQLKWARRETRGERKLEASRSSGNDTDFFTTNDRSSTIYLSQLPRLYSYTILLRAFLQLYTIFLFYFSFIYRCIDCVVGLMVTPG